MTGINRNHVEAYINGPVAITPSPLSMRYNDENTPRLDVWVSYMTHDGKKRPYCLTDKKIVFETITPGGGAGVFSNESGSCFEIINPSQGHFLFTLPPECKDAIGNSKMAYFRFIEGEDIHSTGEFIYTVTRDIYSVPHGVLKTPQNFNQELMKLQDDFKNVDILAANSVGKSGEALETAMKAFDEVDNKQKKVADAVNDNIASLEDGSTKDSGLKVSDVKKAIYNRHCHRNKGLLNKLGLSDERLLFGVEAIIFKSDLPGNMDLLAGFSEDKGRLLYFGEVVADETDLTALQQSIDKKLTNLDAKIEALSENEDGEKVSVEYHILDSMPHKFFLGDTEYKYGFAVNEGGGLSFLYEEANYEED